MKRHLKLKQGMLVEIYWEDAWSSSRGYSASDLDKQYEEGLDCRVVGYVQRAGLRGILLAQGEHKNDKDVTCLFFVPHGMIKRVKVIRRS